MLFKPNFCCNCGVEIKRAEWSVLTSRRFCEVCAVEHKGYEWLTRAIVISGVLAGVFGFGAYMGGSGRPDATQFKAGENEPTRKLAVGAKLQSGIKDEERNSQPEPREEPAAELGVTNRAAAADTGKDRPGSSDQALAYYCGAMTKKGTPCSRRVKTKGKCWQHAGKPSGLVSQSSPDVY